VGVPGKAGEIFLRIVIAKIVEQQKRIEVGRVAETEASSQVDAGALERGLGLDDSFDRSYGHGAPLLSLSIRVKAVKRAASGPRWLE
jgi:hypothetical protein